VAVVMKATFVLVDIPENIRLLRISVIEKLKKWI
jgi:hypothetical protein